MREPDLQPLGAGHAAPANGELRPQLRPLDAQWQEHDGQRALVLRDRMGLAEHAAAVPPALALLLSLCDGTRDLTELQSAFEIRSGVRLSVHELRRLVDDLDAALLLEGPRLEAARTAALAAYRDAPSRPAALAGAVYPATADAAAAMLAQYVARAPETPALDELAGASPLADVRGIVSPHIDYSRGGPVYGSVWSRAEHAVKSAELVIALGTDHAGGAGTWTLTRQHYATPWGVLPTERDVVEELAAIFGPDGFHEELHHRKEHSLELALVWLHYARKGRPVPVVPIICGSFHECTQGTTLPAEDSRYDAALGLLRATMAERRTLVVVGADLAHVGPAFGDAAPYGPAERAQVRAGDVASLRALRAGDAEAFLATIRAERDTRRICGLPPIYFALRLLAPSRGVVVAYDQCSADAEDGSWVSVAGALLGSS